MTINILELQMSCSFRPKFAPDFISHFFSKLKKLCSVIFKINKKKESFFFPQLIENQEIVTISDIRTKEMTPH